MMNDKRLIAALALTALAAAVQAKEIKIADIHSKTGAFEAYGVDSHRGLELGLQYATGGTMMVNGNKLVMITKDDQGKPDLARSHLREAYEDDKADIAVGAISSAATIAMAPVAEEYKKLLIVDSSVADSITGDKWNRYIFRTARNSTQDALTNAMVVDKAGVTIATLAQDYAFGKDGIKAFKAVMKNAKVVHEEYVPTTTSDFTAAAERLINALKDKSGKKFIFIYWAGAGNPLKIADLDLKRHGIEIATGGNTLPALASYKSVPGLEGSIYYYASSEEFVGEFWLRKLAEHVIQREFGDAEGPIAVGFSHSDFGFVVQALDDAAGKLLFGPEVVDEQLAVGAHGAGELLNWIDARAHCAGAPCVEELGGPCR